MPILAQNHLELLGRTFHCSAAPCRLSLAVYTLGAPLPDIQPGALPALEHFYLSLRMEAQHNVLPPIWGGSPQVLPSLLELTIISSIEGRLPAEWAGGFRRLRTLILLDSRIEFEHLRPYGRLPEPVPTIKPEQASPIAMALPPEWSSGFPQLRDLTLSGVPLAGSFPQAWQTGGFPALQSL